MRIKAEQLRRADMDKAVKSGIIKASSAKEEKAMVEMQSLGRIKISLMEKRFKNIQTEDIIVTNERIAHIKERHSEDYELFKIFGADSVQDPDYIIEDCKHNGTVFMVKKLPDTNLNVVCRLALSTDEEGLKNSIMTFYRIRERNLRKLIEKNQLLYKKE